MCGIAGFFGSREVAAAGVDAMFAAIARRGPDASHFAGWDAAGLRAGPESGPTRGLLHTRLSIRDPRPEADQPMANAAGDIWLCYNGEVYGWEDEAHALAQSEGRPFRTRSDTEFILRGYEAWGLEALLPSLRGMFALAILDLRQQKLLLARDRMGLKPLVYYRQGNEFAFGSLVRAVLPYLPAGQRAFSPQAIDAYLAHRYIPPPRTVLRHVERLENAHWLSFDLRSGALEKRCYWRPTAGDGDLGAALDEAVVLRTVADRPVGLFLSGGIDSTLLASRLAANGYANIRSFTAGFDDPSMDESPLAAELAARLGMPNVRVPIPQGIGGDFARIVADLDEPFADPSSFPTWYLARVASREVKVALCGDGGDELFAGYKRYRQHLRSAWRARLPRLPLAAAATVAPTRRQRLALEASLSWEDAYALRFSGLSIGERRALQPDAADLRPQWWRSEPDSPRDAAPLQRLLEIDRLNYLPEYILRKADLVTMAHGLEARAPLLDHRFVEAVTALAPGRRFGTPAKAALRPFCPPCQELGLFERKKRGFNPPLAPIVGHDLAERLPGLGARLTAASNGQLSAAAVEAMLRAYAADASLAEQVLQLLVLEESLSQLAGLAAVRHG